MSPNDQEDSNLILSGGLFAQKNFFSEGDLSEEADLYDKLQNAMNAKDSSQIQAAEEEFIERERLYLLGKAMPSARRSEGEQWNIEFDHTENQPVPLFLEREDEDVMDMAVNEPSSELPYFLAASNIEGEENAESLINSPVKAKSYSHLPLTEPDFQEIREEILSYIDEILNLWKKYIKEAHDLFFLHNGFQ